MRDDHGTPSPQALLDITDGGRSDGTIRLALTGELDLASCGRLSARLEELAASGMSVSLDISGVTFVDSSGLAVLIRHARGARQGGRTLEIGREDLHRQVRRVIELTGADQILWPPPEPGAGAADLPG